MGINDWIDKSGKPDPALAEAETTTAHSPDSSMVISETDPRVSEKLRAQQIVAETLLAGLQTAREQFLSGKPPPKEFSERMAAAIIEELSKKNS